MKLRSLFRKNTCPISWSWQHLCWHSSQVSSVKLASQTTRNALTPLSKGSLTNFEGKPITERGRQSHHRWQKQAQVAPSGTVLSCVSNARTGIDPCLVKKNISILDMLGSTLQQLFPPKPPTVGGHIRDRSFFAPGGHLQHRDIGDHPSGRKIGRIEAKQGVDWKIILLGVR